MYFDQGLELTLCIFQMNVFNIYVTVHNTKKNLNLPSLLITMIERMGTKHGAWRNVDL